MKHSAIAIVLTAVLAVAAGVAIAGLPSSAGDQLIIVAQPGSTSTLPVVPTLPPVNALPATTTTAPVVWVPNSTEAPTTTTVPATTLAPTTTLPLPVLIDRAELDVATANAAGVGGIAIRTADELVGLGYVDVVSVDARQVTIEGAVYHQPGLDLEAARLALDLGWAGTDIRPYSALPDLTTTQEFQLVALIGQDKV